MLTPRVPEMNGDLVGLAANAFARSGVPAPAFMNAISNRIAWLIYGHSNTEMTDFLICGGLGGPKSAPRAGLFWVH